MTAPRFAHKRAVLAFVVMLCNSVTSPAQDATALRTAAAPNDVLQQERDIESIEVIAKRESRRKAINTYVSKVSSSDGEFLARWHKPVCLYLSGMSNTQTDFLRSRMSQTARTAGIPIIDTRGCDANVFIFLTNNANQLLAKLKERNPRIFANDVPHNVESIPGGNGPVRVWYNAELRNSDGTPPIEHTSGSSQSRLSEYRLANSRIESSVAEHMNSVVIVVDLQFMPAITLTQLSDYVSMLAFARVGLDADFSAIPTILRLFSGSNPGRDPAALTAWDTAYLAGLYQTEHTVVQQGQRIEAYMDAAMESAAEP